MHLDSNASKASRLLLLISVREAVSPQNQESASVALLNFPDPPPNRLQFWKVSLMRTSANATPAGVEI